MDSEVLNAELQSLFQPASLEPQTNVYSDSVYQNYFELGVSIMYAPATGYRPQAANLDHSKLHLQSIDIYNASTTATSEKRPYRPCPLLPLYMTTAKGSQMEINVATTGKDLVEALGEPPRKGGGDGPSSGSIDIWFEWPKYGIMVEFGLRGPQAWDKGKDTAWKTITIFSPID